MLLGTSFKKFGDMFAFKHKPVTEKQAREYLTLLVYSLIASIVLAGLGWFIYSQFF